MSSIIEGFTYDIFISYRQKDNKHDGWVTEFVDNLKGELESTFKEEISVYFDINPHDGLLETHDVDASLKDKLKCLVFIPIISRTYCDPKSFAWEHEFKAFIEQASQDQFGLKVKLPNGNVANRVLPIRIYDLDNSDIKLCESILGGIMRGVEFIYKEAGVNRPLRANEENPHDNLNRTIYRNQINKAANAIKEVITAIGQSEQKVEEVTREAFKPLSVPRKSNKTKIIAGSLILLTLLLLGYFIIPKLFNTNEEVEKSIAVLPFVNLSEDLNQEQRCDALTNEIINHLHKIKSIDRVVPFASVMIYKKPNKNILKIANEKKVNYILDGTYQRIGDSLKITVSLIEPKSDRYLWQNDYNKSYKEIISILSDIALQIASHVNAFLTVSEKQNIQKRPTQNQEAYDIVQQAAIYLYKSLGDPNFAVTDQYWETGKNLALKAIELDPNYADAYAWAGLFSLWAGAYSGNKEMSVAVVDALPFIEKALELDQNNSNAHYVMANINEYGRWDYIKAEKEYFKVIELAPNKSEYYNVIGEFFLKMNRLDKAIFFSKKAFESELIDPTTVLLETLILSGNKIEAISTIEKYLKSQPNPDYQRVGECFIWMEEYDSARFYLETALKYKVSEMLVPRFQACLAFAYSKIKNPHQAQTIINQIINKSKKTSAMSPDYFIGWYYSRIGKVDSAFYWLERACQSRSAEMPWLKVDPAFKNLKNDNRYYDLYKRTGHKAYDDYMNSLKK